MRCPKCHFEQGSTLVECPRCGVVIAKYRGVHESLTPRVIGAPPTVASTIEGSTSGQFATAVDSIAQAAFRAEFIARAVAIPSALLASWWAVSAAPGIVRLFAMWVHETGHAVAAWLCSHAALPGPWITPVGSERSLPLLALFVAALGCGAYRACQAARWFWVVSAGVVTILLLCCTFLLRPGQVQQLIVFSGDGGCFVLGSCLMLTVYARKDSALRANNLRWGLLCFGALAFMDAYATWCGSADRIPFGENDNGLSDPSVLTEEYGWSVALLQGRYQQVATVCVVILGCAYAGGLLWPWLMARQVDDRA